MTVKITDDKAFGSKLAGFVSSSKNQRQTLQDLIEYGLESYKGHADTSALSKVVNALVGVRTIPSKTIKEYIQDHANVRLVKVKDSSLYVFKKDGKEVKVTTPEVVWWEHESNKANHKLDIIDPVALIRVLGKKLLEAKEAGKVVAGREEMTDDILGRIREFCNMEPVAKEVLKKQASLSV